MIYRQVLSHAVTTVSGIVNNMQSYRVCVSWGSKVRCRPRFDECCWAVTLPWFGICRQELKKVGNVNMGEVRQLFAVGTALITDSY